QAEDGIRDFHVTGVQTCALPIFRQQDGADHLLELVGRLPLVVEYRGCCFNDGIRRIIGNQSPAEFTTYVTGSVWMHGQQVHHFRSEERRVGKEWRPRAPAARAET